MSQFLSRSGGPTPTSPPSVGVPPAGTAHTPGRKHGPGRPPSEGYEQYPFPLERNRLAYLHIPGGRLTEHEASRLKAFIDSLVIQTEVVSPSAASAHVTGGGTSQEVAL